jgi:hypothetical protein
MFGGKWPVVEFLHRRRGVLGQQQGDLCRDIEAPQLIGDRGQRAALAHRSPRERCLDQAPPLIDFQRHVLAGGVLDGQIVAEGCPCIPPRLNGDPMSANPRWHECRGPAIVRHQPHRDAMPLGLVVRAPTQLGGEHVVAVGNDVGADRDMFADQPFHGKRAIRDLRQNGLHGDARSAKTTSIEVGVADHRMDHGSRRHIGENAHLARVHRRIRVLAGHLQDQRRAGPRWQRRDSHIQRNAASEIGIGQHHDAARRVPHVRRVRTQQCRDSVLRIAELAHITIDLIGGDAIDLLVRVRDICREIAWSLVARPLKILWRAQCGIEGPAGGILEAHRHEHPAAYSRGQPQGEAIGGVDIAAKCQPHRAPLEERRLWRRDHRRDAPQQFDLLDQPVRPSVPPGKRGTHEVEADPFQTRQRCAFDAWRPGQEAALLRPQSVDDLMPERSRRDIGVQAAEA